VVAYGNPGCILLLFNFLSNLHTHRFPFKEIVSEDQEVTRDLRLRIKENELEILVGL
jgi:hypothetical protein